LPPFVLAGGPANWAETLDGLALSGHFLARDVLTDRAEPLLDARARLLDRLRRAAGLA
jgi:DNA repair protein RecO (recombination protein O)